MIAAGEAGDVADAADDGGGDDRADTEDLGDGGPGGLDRCREFRLGVAHRRVDAPQILGEVDGELAAGCLRPRSAGVIDSRIRAACACGDPLGDAAGDQLAQHRVQPAGHLGPGAAQVPVALGPHFQYRCVIIGCHLAAGRRAQRRDRHRTGIVRVVLVRVPRREQPHPGAQLGWHIQHPLTRRQQLLGQQVTQATGALDRPGPLRPGRRPPQQPLRLCRPARTLSSPSTSSAALIATAVCETLCGSTPIITAAMNGPSSCCPVGPWRACLIPEPCWRSRLF